MKTIVQTSRFGEIEATSEHYIDFRDGMIGFPHLKRYILVESSSMPLLLWLQSTENHAVAFPVVEPWFFKRDYNPPMVEADRSCLRLAKDDRTKMFVVLTIPPEMTRMTVNLKAPVMINLTQGTAVQMVLADKQYEVRVPAHEAFSKAVASLTLSQVMDRDIPVELNTQDDSWSAVDVKEAGWPSSLAMDL